MVKITYGITPKKVTELATCTPLVNVPYCPGCGDDDGDAKYIKISEMNKTVSVLKDPDAIGKYSNTFE